MLQSKVRLAARMQYIGQSLMPDDQFLAIELPAGLTALLAEGRDIVSVRSAELEALGSRIASTACAACPLFFDGGDAIQIIELLEASGYGGPLLVVAPKLPNHRMVQAELSREARRLKVSLISP